MCAVSAREFDTAEEGYCVQGKEERTGGQFKLIFRLDKGLVIPFPVSNFQDICGIAIDFVETITRGEN